MSVYIAPIGHGLGDLIVSLPAVQYLIASGQPTYLVLRSPRQEGFEHLIPGLSGSLREVDLLNEGVPAGSRYLNLRAHPLQTDHVWGSAEFEAKYPGYKIADIVSGICHDLGIKADFKNLQPLPCRENNKTSGKVLFIPGSGGTFKCWPRDHWLNLHEQVCKIGLEVLLLGQPDVCHAVSELMEAGLAWLPTPRLEDALDAVSSARAVISVDTGLMHMALQQGTAVVAMYINNPGSLNYLRTVKNCFPIVSPRCQRECVSEELDKELNLKVEWDEWCGYDSWTCHADASTRCMNQISPDSVFKRFMEALEFANDTENKKPAIENHNWSQSVGTH